MSKKKSNEEETLSQTRRLLKFIYEPVTDERADHPAAKSAAMSELIL